MIEVHLYSHFFKIMPGNNTQLRKCCDQLAYRLIQWKINSSGYRATKTADCVYAASNKQRSEFRFHINSLPDFKSILLNNGIRYDTVTEVTHPFEPINDIHVEYKVRPNWKPREDQLPVIDYVVNQKVHPNHLVTLSTGTGKSFINCMAMAQMGVRAVFIIKPAFIEKWVSDLMGIFEFTAEDVVTISGAAQLRLLIQNAMNGFTLPKVIIISNRTYQNYLKFYEEYGDETLDLGYDCLPENLFSVLSAGTRVVDEVHLDFHLNFKTDLYTNIPHTNAMSASLIDNDSFKRDMYNLAYPYADRYKAPPPKKYIRTIGMRYRLNTFRQPRTTNFGRKEYSHGVYEKWLSKDKKLLSKYFRMIKDILDGEYIQYYRPGDRALVFCYSIQMATDLTKYLREQYPDKSVERYVEEDQYKNVMEPDIRVSTVLSAGTGIDIAKLRVSILSTAINSPKSNIQALGRLRELHGDDRPPVFIWLTCVNIPKHLEYHKAKKELFVERTLSHSDRDYEYPL